MKQVVLSSLRSVQRPVALMLALIPIGCLAVCYGLVIWSARMAEYGGMMDPNVTEIVSGFGTFFREYAMPVLALTVGLATVNLFTAFARPAR